MLCIIYKHLLTLDNGQGHQQFLNRPANFIGLYKLQARIQLHLWRILYKKRSKETQENPGKINRQEEHKKPRKQDRNSYFKWSKKEEKLWQNNSFRLSMLPDWQKRNFYKKKRRIKTKKEPKELKKTIRKEQKIKNNKLSNRSKKRDQYQSQAIISWKR